MELIGYNQFYFFNVKSVYILLFLLLRRKDIDDIITNMAIGELVIKQDSVFIGNLQCIKKSLMIFDNLKEELETEITEIELNDIASRVKKYQRCQIL